MCQGLAREAEAERLFCVVSTPRGDQVLAIDCDGYPLGYAAERLADGGLSDLVFRFTGGVQSFEPHIVRRVSRASKRTVIAAKIRVGGELGVSLILENRFAGEGLASFDDAQVVRWLLILALVVRLNAAGEQPARPVPASRGAGVGQPADFRKRFRKRRGSTPRKCGRTRGARLGTRARRTPTRRYARGAASGALEHQSRRSPFGHDAPRLEKAHAALEFAQTVVK